MVPARLGGGCPRRRRVALVEDEVEVQVAAPGETLGRELVVPGRDQLRAAPPPRPGIAVSP
jgi:hypothetical protein